MAIFSQYQKVGHGKYFKNIICNANSSIDFFEKYIIVY